MSERRLQLDTPEGITLQLALASVGERLAALIVDLAVLAMIYAAVAVSFSVGLDAPALVVFAGFFVRHGYFVVFESRWQGRTPGKRLLGLKVVQRDGGSLDGRSVLARNLVRDVELVLPLFVLASPEALTGESPLWLWIPAMAWAGVFALLPIVHRHRMRAGDLVAGTVVVRLPVAALKPDEAGGASSGRWSLGAHHLAIYGASELETLARILREVDPQRDRGHELFTRIAQTIAHKVGIATAAVEHDPDGFLRAFYGAQRAHLERQQLLGRRKADTHG
ncbi:MAG TPA: RDD family protein [Nannocystaceae bacterium]|nr:RDD family protein [Nannocystaceae bacterium]